MHKEIEKKTFEISFDDDQRTPVLVESGRLLSTVLDVTNSPVLFGCRTGICGTCLIEVTEVTEGTLPTPDVIEAESLDLYAPDRKNARLACQISSCASFRLRKINPL